MAGEIDLAAGEPWTLRDEDGSAVEVYFGERLDPARGETFADSVCVNVPTPGPPILDLPRLRALIAELTRRAALLAGEAGEERTADLTPDEVEALRAAAHFANLRSEHAPLVTKLADWHDEDNNATTAYCLRELARWLRAGVAVGADGQVRSAEPARTAEDERADVLALLTKLHGWAAERSAIGRTKALEDVAYMIRNGAHVGVAAAPAQVAPAWAGPGYYAGHDTAGRSVLLHAETPTGLARIGAAAGVARWSGPYPSLGAAGEAVEKEGGQ